MWINKGNWSWAGVLLFFAQVAWIFAILNLVMYSFEFILQIASEGSFHSQLPLALDIQNLTEQFNSQITTQEVRFDNRVTSRVDAIGNLSVPGAILYVASLMKLVGCALYVYILSLVKNVLLPIKLGKPFQTETGRNLYKIGGIICIVTPGKFLYEWIIYHFMSQYPLPSNLSVQWPLPDLTYLFVGLIVLSVAYVFNKGARMAREQQLTV